MNDMVAAKLRIDGKDYAVIPWAEYQATRGKSGEVDALAFAQAAIAKDLRAAREHAGISQAQLAAKTKKSQAWVSGTESGRLLATEKYVAAVLKACGLPKDWKSEGGT